MGAFEDPNPESYIRPKAWLSVNHSILSVLQNSVVISFTCAEWDRSVHGTRRTRPGKLTGTCGWNASTKLSTVATRFSTLICTEEFKDLQKNEHVR
jgi:hypothetical protein